jgi:hypothetical protein
MYILFHIYIYTPEMNISVIRKELLIITIERNSC